MVLFLSFSPWEVRLPVHSIFSSSLKKLIPSASCCWSRESWGWIHSVLDLFLNPLPGWRLPPGPLPAFEVNLLIVELSVNICTNLGESGSQGVLTTVLAGEKSIILLLEGTKTSPLVMVFLCPGPQPWHWNIALFVFLVSLRNFDNNIIIIIR